MTNIKYKLPDGYYYSWEQLIATILSYPKHTDIIVSYSVVPSLPQDFKERIGILTNGRLAHYSKSLPDGKSIHVKIYKEHYEIHWDEKDPNEDPIRHLVYDAPEYLAAGIAIGAGIGLGAYAWHRYNKKKKKG